jgi:hypothetical protein
LRLEGGVGDPQPGEAILQRRHAVLAAFCTGLGLGLGLGFDLCLALFVPPREARDIVGQLRRLLGRVRLALRHRVGPLLLMAGTPAQHAAQPQHQEGDDHAQQHYVKECEAVAHR